SLDLLAEFVELVQDLLFGLPVDHLAELFLGVWIGADGQGADPQAIGTLVHGAFATPASSLRCHVVPLGSSLVARLEVLASTSVRRGTTTGGARARPAAWGWEGDGDILFGSLAPAHRGAGPLKAPRRLLPGCRTPPGHS